MEILNYIAQLMELSARTAPKSKGEDYIITKILDKEALQELGKEMIKLEKETGKEDFDRDGENVLKSDVILLIGLKDATPLDLNCGACGREKCVEINFGDEYGEFLGPQCALRLLDMGIAIGSAVKTASLFNVDNRIMYSIGVVARKLGIIDADFVMGIPLSAMGKNIYFDRNQD